MPLNGNIFFHTTDHNNHHSLFMLRMNDLSTEHLESEMDGFLPVPSPSGQMVLFQSVQDGVVQIYAMNISKSDIPHLIYSQGSGSPNWSPNGQYIAFVAAQAQPISTAPSNNIYFHVYVINADGSDIHQLTKGSQDYAPSWSPDGKQIAFIEDRKNNGQDIYSINADGSNLRDLFSSPNKAEIRDLLWSPDGKLICFSMVQDSNLNIFTINIDGSNLKQLSNGGYNGSPAWSPDGKYIAYSSNHDNKLNIFLMNPDGSNQHPLTDNALDDSPAWSPDSQSITFVSKDNGIWGVYVIGIDGSSQRRLADIADDSQPKWSP